MTAAVAEDEAGGCPACGERLLGRYCHDCGHDSRPPRRSARDLLEDFCDNVLSFTGVVPRTIRALILQPSRVPRAQLDGDRVRYLSPMKLYVSASLVFFLFLGISGVSIFQVKVERIGEGPPVVRTLDDPGPETFHMRERWLHPARAAPRDAQVVAAFDRALPGVEDDVERTYMAFARRVADDTSDLNADIATWAPRALWLMMPLHAMLLWPLFRRGHLLAEHLILSLWAHTTIFLALIFGALWNMIGLAYGLTVAIIAYQVYFTVALRGYYAVGWRTAVLKGAVHSFAYIGLLWLPLTIVFFFAQVLSALPASFWES